GYTGYVFTGNLDLAKNVGLRTKGRIPFYNGPIECRLLEYDLYEGSRKK
ncbi:MAG TPA: class I SAM-dependent RNA methyltransferase, partial [Thermodesulfobacteriota bacterium]|nr:class I SAM-dependent RNA methyltransferase [Thermodesulfobacteriota bacterium]